LTGSVEAYRRCCGCCCSHAISCASESDWALALAGDCHRGLHSMALTSYLSKFRAAHGTLELDLALSRIYLSAEFDGIDLAPLIIGRGCRRQKTRQIRIRPGFRQAVVAPCLKVRRAAPARALAQDFARLGCGNFSRLHVLIPHQADDRAGSCAVAEVMT